VLYDCSSHNRPHAFPHALAYIRPHRDGYRAEVEKHGMRASKTFATKRDANAWAIRKEAEFEALKGSRGRTFLWARTHYVQTVSSRKSAGSSEWEERRLAAMAEFFDDSTLLASIDSERIGQWRDHRLLTVSGSTVQREANLLRNLFTVAADEWKCIPSNPFRGVRLPEHAPPRQAVWGWREIRRVLRAPRSGKTLEVIRAFSPVLATNGGGAIVNVLSALSWFATPFGGGYAAAKAAAWNLTNAVRLELAGQGTLVQGVFLGAADTDMSAGYDGPVIDPRDVPRASLDGLETGAIEVVVDDWTAWVKASLAGDPAEFYELLRERLGA